MPFFSKVVLVVCVSCIAVGRAAPAQPPPAGLTIQQPNTELYRPAPPPSSSQFNQRPPVGRVEYQDRVPSQATGAPPTNPSRILPPRSIRPPSERSTDRTNRPKSTRVKTPVSSLTTALGALAVVLGLFFLSAWLLKRAMPKGSAVLPSDVVEVLGRCPLANRQFVHLVRVGNKLLLVSVSATGAETLTEVTDPGEVDRLAGICRRTQEGSTTTAFRQVFQQFSREPTSPGFVDEPLADSPSMSGSGQPMEATDA